MRPTLLAALCAATLAALPAHAVFKCTVGGKTTYSDAPCGDGGREIDTTPAAGRGGRGSSAESLEALKSTSASFERDRIRRDLGFQIRDAERQIDILQSRMDKEISALQRKKQSASNNLAGATWEESISSEMQAIAARYKASMDVEQAKIDHLRKRMAAMDEKAD